MDRARIEYNSEGRYFDEQAGVVYDDAGVLFFGTITLACLVLGTLALVTSRLLRKDT